MQIFPLIQSHQLLDHLTNLPSLNPTITIEDKEVSNPKFVDWQKNDLLLRSWIIGTLSEEALAHVIGMNTAREVWLCLEETYLQVTKEK